jgi:hypothetical protein
MAIGRTLQILVCSTALSGALGGCLSAGNAQAPAGVRLEGSWKLDRSASDDPQKQLDKLREASARNARRFARTVAQQQGQAQQPSGRGGSRRGGPAPGGDTEDISMRAPLELQYNPEMQTLQAFLRHGDYLTVRQDPEHFVLDYGSSGRTYTPGAHSVVSNDYGVADQVSGWKGSEYVISLRPQVGPGIDEQYGLSPDRQHLVVKLHIDSTDLPAVDLKQVYVRTDEILPRSMPSND